MADFNTNPRAARVDMTPMVDLGFLLITFFMYTTTFSSQNLMKLVLPKDETEQTASLSEKNTLTVILGKNDEIFWHQKNLNSLQVADFQMVKYGKSLRRLIVEKRKLAKNPQKFTVIIHPTEECTYKNVVDILDEMAITAQKHYALTDIFQKELKLYQALK